MSPSQPRLPLSSSEGAPYAQVVFNLPLLEPFTYQIPDSMRSVIQPGMRVRVPFGPQKQTGYVVGLSETCDPGIKLKSILEICDGAPLLDPPLLELTHWVAGYYQAGWGEVLRTALPAGLEGEIPETLYLTGPGQEALDSGNLSRTQKTLLMSIAEKGKRTAKQLRKKLGTAFRADVLARLKADGLIEALIVTPKSSAQFKVGKQAQVSPRLNPEDKAKLLNRAPRQKALFDLIAEKPRTLSDLSKLFPGYSPVLSQLKRKKLIQTRPHRQDRWAALEEAPQEGTEAPLRFTSEQDRAFRDLQQKIKSGNFHAALLHGITGSGKTEIYLRCIAEVLNRGGTALMLVPEIALTPQTALRFRRRFGSRVAILHSGLSNIERYLEWRRLREGRATIALGARSAVFAPLKNLGLLIVDEEHDTSYKQDTAPRYHARDTAVMRGRTENAVVILGSATPSLESRHNAEAGKYTYLRLTGRVGGATMPPVKLIDMRKERDRKNFSILSRELQRAIGHRLDHGEQVFLFLNRRGTANYVLCKRCGFVFECPRCSVSLTFHGRERRMLCHYCSFSMQEPAVCPSCEGEVIRFSGFGTQKLEEDVQKLFPRARLARLDRDTARNKAAFESVFDRMTAAEIDILIGTQMITKGHDFPNVTLVGVVYADLSLNVPDFRSSERTFQLLTQVAGRAGRGRLPGQVLVQAHHLEHEVYRFVRDHDYNSFYQAEMNLRQRLHFPPFSRLAVIEIESSDETEGQTTVERLQATATQLLDAHADVELIGPAPAALYRLNERFRWHLILRASGPQPLQAILHELMTHPDYKRLSTGKSKIIIDVDPVNML